MAGKPTVVVVIFGMFARQTLVRTAVLISGIGLFLVTSVVLLRRSDPDFMRDDEMQLPKINSGVWVTGFEESSFFPGDEAIPEGNDPRRYRIQLIASREQHDRLRNLEADTGYKAYRVTFLGRRTKFPVAIDCYGRRYYDYIPDWILLTRPLGSIADPDLPVRKAAEPYKPFKRSGEGGKIRELEDKALAHCSGSTRSAP